MGISLSGLTESSTGNLTISAGSGNDVLIGNGSTQIFIDGGTDTLGIGGTAVSGSRLNIETGAVALDFITSTGTAVNVIADTVNDTSGAATLAIVPTVQIGVMTYTSTNSMTYTDTASLYIAGIPAASTNVTFTNAAYALWVDAGAVRFDDRTFWIGGIAYEFPADNGNANEMLLTDGSGNLSWSSVASASVATTVTVTDNEDTNENNLIPFVANAATSTGNHGLEMDGDFTYSPNTGRLTATQLSGTLQTAAQGNVTSLGTLTGLGLSGDISLAAAAIVWTSGATTVGSEYSIQQDSAGTDHLQFNVPSGKGFKFSINAVEEVIWSTGALAFQQATTLSTTAGNLTLSAATGADVLIGDNATILYVDGGTGTVGIGAAATAINQVKIASALETADSNMLYAYRSYTDATNNTIQGIRVEQQRGRTSAAFTGSSLGIKVTNQLADGNRQAWTRAVGGLVGVDVLLGSGGANATGTVTAAVGFNSYITMAGYGANATTTNYIGFRDAGLGNGTTTNRYGFYVAETSGTVTNNYGLYVEELTQGSSLDYSIYTAGATPSYFGGNVTLAGSSNNNTVLDIQVPGTGDPTITFTGAGTSVDWHIGVDNSHASEGLYLGKGTAVGTDAYIRLDGRYSAGSFLIGLAHDPAAITLAEASNSRLYMTYIAGNTVRFTGGTQMTSVDGSTLYVDAPSLVSGNNAAITIDAYNTIYTKTPRENDGYVALTTAAAIRISDGGNASHPAANNIGLYVESLTTGTNDYSVYTAGTTPSNFGGAIHADGAITGASSLDIAGRAAIGSGASVGATTGLHVNEQQTDPAGLVGTISYIIPTLSSGASANIFQGFRVVNDLRGNQNYTETENGAQTGNAGISIDMINRATATVTEMFGVTAHIRKFSTGAVTTAAAYKVGTWGNFNSTNAITTLSGLHVTNPTATGGITTLYGIKIDDLTTAGTEWSVYTGSAPSYFGGSVTATSTISHTGASHNHELDGSGGSVSHLISNTGTAANDVAYLELKTAGVTHGTYTAPHVRFTTGAGASPHNWYTGTDLTQYEADTFHIGTGTTVGSNARVSISSQNGRNVPGFRIDPTDWTSSGTTSDVGGYTFRTLAHNITWSSDPGDNNGAKWQINSMAGGTMVNSSSAQTFGSAMGATTLYVVPPSAGSNITFTHASGINIANVASAGTTTNLYGIYIDDLSGGATNYAIYTAGSDAVSLGGVVTIRGSQSYLEVLEAPQNNGVTIKGNANPALLIQEDSQEQWILYGAGSGLYLKRDGTIQWAFFADGDMHPYGHIRMKNSKAIYDVGASGNNWTANALTITGTYNGEQSLQVWNTDNDVSHTTSHSLLYLVTFGSGDSKIKYATGVNFSHGIDHSESRWVLSRGHALGSTDVMRVTTAGATTFDSVGSEFTPDYVCDSCGRAEIESFECCGTVAWHDDVLALREMKLSQSGIDHMAKLGVLEIDGPDDADPGWTGINYQKAQYFTWAGMYQNRQRMDAQYDEHESRFGEKIRKLETLLKKMLGEKEYTLLMDQIE